MNAQAVNLKFISGIQNIEIPFFQRPYVWEEEQLERFFDDLKNSYINETPHFLGSVILKDLGNNNFSLIDGQQRLTTFSIFVKTLFDKISDPDKLADYKKLIYKKPTYEKNSKITHSEKDKNDFDEILKSNSCDLNGKLELKNSKLWFCYYYFSDRLDNDKDISDKFKFLEYISSSKLLVKVTLENKDDEQKIFDSINSAGMVLTACDIIKNALFDRLLKQSDSQEKVKKIYEKYWQEVFEKEENIKFWESKSKNRYKNEMFLYYYAIINGFFDLKNHNQDDLRIV